MRVRILYHDHCFDGAAAAAYFSRFLEERFHPDAEFLFTGLAHKADQIFEDWMFDGEVNAIVDFKYSPDPRLTWWFDHHQSAFIRPEDAEQYRLHPSERKLYDPEAASCTGFIARVARERWNWEAPDLAELVRWAEIIDGAQYPDARTAVEMPAAAMKLTLVIEGVKGSEPVHQIIRWMRRRTLDEIITEPAIHREFAPLYERHLRSIEIIRNRARCADGVVSFDLVGYDLEGYNKFIPYYLFPESVYSVSVSTSSFRTKVSVGSNPWAPRSPRHNLASLCERYGGGGHARVGAISFPLGEYEQARRAAEEIAEELRREAQ